MLTDTLCCDIQRDLLGGLWQAGDQLLQAVDKCVLRRSMRLGTVATCGSGHKPNAVLEGGTVVAGCTVVLLVAATDS